jgi:hypothetical protein
MFSDTKVVNTSTIANSTGTTGARNATATAELGGEDAQTAVENGSVALANQPTANTSLGLNVECVLFPPLSTAFFFLRLIHA